MCDSLQNNATDTHSTTPMVYEIDDDDDDDEVMEVTNDNQNIVDITDTEIQKSPGKSKKANNVIDLDVETIDSGTEKELKSPEIDIVTSNKATKKTKVANVIDLDDDCVIAEEKSTNNIENELYTTFYDIIRFALSYDDSIQMHRIVVKNLIPLFKETITKQENFRKLSSWLTTTKMLLEKNPELRYSHLISLSSKMRKLRKKVHFVTLSREVTQKRKEEIKQTKNPKQYKPSPKKRKKKQNIVIDLDAKNSQDDDVIILPNNNESIEIDSDHTDEETQAQPNGVNKENFTKTADNLDENTKKSVDPPINNNPLPINNIINQPPIQRVNINNPLIVTVNPAPIITTNVIPVFNIPNLAAKPMNLGMLNTNNIVSPALNPVVLMNRSPILIVNNIPTPGSSNALVPTQILSIDEEKKKRVEFLEAQILRLKKSVADLEQKEVDCDDFRSPYLAAELVKVEIIKIYKEICKIMEAEPVKRHEVRFKVANGHPEGPIKCLEEHLNRNIDEQGNPPFPDLADVVHCVTKANMEYKLGWTPRMINQEAKILLKQYGEALQERRKKREWRDLIGYCDQDMVDPADFDPVLEAKLQANRVIAKKNEDEFFNKYAEMEDEMRRTKTSLDLCQYSDDSDTDSNVNPVVLDSTLATYLKKNVNNGSVSLETVEVSFEPDCTSNNNIVDKIAEVKENNKVIKDNLRVLANTPVMPKIESVISEDNTADVSVNPIVCPKIEPTNDGSSNILQKINEMKENNQNDSNIKVVIENCINISPKLLIEKPKMEDNGPSSESLLVENGVKSSESFINDYSNVVVKEETNVVEKVSEDIPKLLNDLGDNFTTAIFDIEDPFLVIEISDSSDSEAE